MIDGKRGSLFLVITILVVIAILAGVIAYFVQSNNRSGVTLPADICIYGHEKNITCGTAFVLVLEGIEYPLLANEPFYFPQGENKLIGLVDESKPKGERAFLLFLKEGEHTLNEETSRRAVGSSLAN